MKDLTYSQAPTSIVCMTEESVETLFLLGQEHLIKGVSAFVERPPQAKSLPVLSTFTHANIKKILRERPDLVLGFSDIQKDIARELIAAGLEVWIANHRSLGGILSYILRLGAMVDARPQAVELVDRLRSIACEVQERVPARKPKVYFEEWDDPMIGPIQWVAEAIEWAGGMTICSPHHQSPSQGRLAQDRLVSSEAVIEFNPDIIFACWCGKKADLKAIKSRPGWQQVAAVERDQVFELDPAIFLQPGPAIFLAGLQQFNDFFRAWERS